MRCRCFSRRSRSVSMAPEGVDVLPLSLSDLSLLERGLLHHRRTPVQLICICPIGSPIVVILLILQSPWIPRGPSKVDAAWLQCLDRSRTYCLAAVGLSVSRRPCQGPTAKREEQHELLPAVHVRLTTSECLYIQQKIPC